jgi:hypothetical protein
MPDITATRPTSGTPIETSWGDEVHDAIEGIQYGTVTWNMVAGARSDAPPIVFPRPYATPPVVFVSVPNGFQTYAAGIASQITTAGVTVCVMTNSGVALTAGPITVAWLAIGKPA